MMRDLQSSGAAFTASNAGRRAAPVDGSVNYTRENVSLSSGFQWKVP